MHRVIHGPLTRSVDQARRRPRRSPPGFMCYPTVRMSLTNLLDLLPAEIESLVESLGAPRYRGRQIADWIYRKGVTDLARMTNVPRDLREALCERAQIGLPVVDRRTPSQDGSEKFVF